VLDASEHFFCTKLLRMFNHTTKRDGIFRMRLEESPDFRERTADIMRLENLDICL